MTNLDKYEEFISGSGIDDFISFITENEIAKTKMSYYFADGLEQTLEKNASLFTDRISKIYNTIFSQNNKNTIYEIPYTNNRPMKFTKSLGDILVTSINSILVE